MVKTLSFAVVHFTVAFTVGYLMTGSVIVGGAIALVEPTCNTVAYFFHEKVWEKLTSRRVTRFAADQQPWMGNELMDYAANRV